MSDIQLYLLEVDKNKPEAQSTAARSASKLEHKELKLIDLITSLEDYINNKDDAALRAKSVAYLADVLEAVPPKVLTGQERRLLCDFILGRLEGDSEGIGASARVLTALEERGKWDPETVQRVTKTFLDHASPLKDHKLQTDRFAVIQLFDRLLEKYRAPLHELHTSDPEFLAKFIYFFDGEKDPRNLMVVFSILHVPMTEWDISSNAQDLFEAAFNYFPITFKPPPDDPYGISAQDLKDRLRDCIAANSQFAPFAFPALLDKLDSTSMNTKRDVLHTIQSCVVSYDIKTINIYAITLWDALKFEILNVQEEDLAEGALKALALMAGKFALQEGFLNAYTRPIMKECNQHLEDAPTKQSTATGRILYALASSATPVADKVVKGIFPNLFTLYQASESLTKRRGLLEVFNEVVRAYLDRFRLQPKLNLEGLIEYGRDALGVMLRVLTNAPKAEVSLRLTALSGIAQLVALRGLLTEDQGYRAVDAVTEIVLHEQVPGHGDIRSQAIKTLAEMARTAPDAIRNQAIPAFMVELPDSPAGDSSYLSVLEAFAQLSSEQQVFDTVVLRLKNKYNVANAQGASEEYQQAMLLAILYAFTHGSPMPDEEGVIRGNYFAEYVEPFSSTIIQPLQAGLDQKFVDIVGRLCNAILRQQGVHFQSQVYNKNLDSMAAIRNDTTRSSAHTAPFTLYYYASLRPDVVEAEDIIALLQTQAKLALDTKDHETLPVVLQHISLLINKFINAKAMQATLQSAELEVEALLSAVSPPPNSIGVAFAVTKALLIQGKSSALTSEYLQLLLQLLSSPDGKSVAKRFTSLLAPEEILTKENHCQVSGLYKQKTFSRLVPSLAAAVRSAEPSTKPNYLIALSGILRWLPYSMLSTSLPSLTPPLLQTLDLSSPADQEPKASTLTIFESVLMHDPDTIAEHTASLVTRLLNCTAAPANIAKVRAKSLQCLALVPKQLKREAVVPYRRQVVKKLMACLDDGKREVRAEGVRCRSAWLGLDDVEEDGEED
ncbi:uncharacterized protein LTR77_001471 [Saxophila tyrrhenica]|uniref:MMS19 nucleotide excision repair protein n=1 Tax=Saxophila tyrrhenica TaxID=1690608 RepID=A0AAV9PKX0_9PEZI|nr:hypothetical protein LTR77_001471 [Saxophila tyrrhenica]